MTWALAFQLIREFGPWVVTIVAGWLGVKKLTRIQKILAFAKSAFAAVEPMDLPGSDKWKTAVKMIFDTMDAAGLGQPTGKEFALMERLGQQYALSTKPKAVKITQPVPITP